MKKRIYSFWTRLKSKFGTSPEEKKKLAVLECEIKILKNQLESLYNVVREQSTIIIAVTKAQADLARAISEIENTSQDEDCFLIKIPLRDDGIAN